MLTEHEANEFYTELLSRLQDLGAGDLVREIELVVLRGALREESGLRRKGHTYQTRLSPREALQSALRMVLAALDPVFHVAHVQHVTGMDGVLPNVSWAFDRLEAVEHLDRDMTLEPDLAARGELEELPTLDRDGVAKLRQMTKQLASLVLELEAEEE